MTFTTATAGRVRRRNSSSIRLDVPVSGRTLLPRPDREAFARIAEVIARFIGTARFLAIQTVVVIIWIALNVAIPFMKWDPYPFILLNLAFSTQAAYAAPLILLAQNRQDDRDRASLTEDRAAAVRMREDTEFLAREVAALRIGVADAATRQYVRGELAHQLDALRDDLELLVRSVAETAANAATTAAMTTAAGPGLGNAVPGTTAASSYDDRQTRQASNDTAGSGSALLAATAAGGRQARPQPPSDLLVPTTVRSPRNRSSRSGRRSGNGRSNSTPNGSGDHKANREHGGTPVE